MTLQPFFKKKKEKERYRNYRVFWGGFFVFPIFMYVVSRLFILIKMIILFVIKLRNCPQIHLQALWVFFASPATL